MTVPSVSERQLLGRSFWQGGGSSSATLFRELIHSTTNVRHVPRELEVMTKEWESLNEEIVRDSELARMHRDDCRTTSRSRRKKLSGTDVPTLLQIRHNLSLEKQHACVQ